MKERRRPIRLEQSLRVGEFVEIDRGPFEEGVPFEDVLLRRHEIIELVHDEKDDLLNERRAPIWETRRKRNRHVGIETV